MQKMHNYFKMQDAKKNFIVEMLIQENKFCA
jgi:hypothetical protein